MLSIAGAAGNQIHSHYWTSTNLPNFPHLTGTHANNSQVHTHLLLLTELIHMYIHIGEDLHPDVVIKSRASKALNPFSALN